MMRAGVRDLKDNLSRYLRRIDGGHRVLVTAHGRVVAELAPPSRAGSRGRADRYAALVASGDVRPAPEAGDPLENWPDIRLPPGSVRRLIDDDREER